MTLDTKPSLTSAAFREQLNGAAQVTRLLPGLCLAGVVAAIAMSMARLANVDALNPLLLAVVLGIGWRHIGKPSARYRPGIVFCMKWVLRLAVVLLGLRLSVSDVLSSGGVGVAVVAVSTLSTFGFTCWLGHRLRIRRELTQLIAAGTSVCGASAIVAANATVEGSEEDITYAVATITGFGTLAMFSYPLVAAIFEFDPNTFGLWCGASIHEVAQVVATAFQRGTTSGELATLTKLTRVLLLVPIVVGLGWQRSQTKASEPKRSLPIPWFVVLFCGCIVVNSLPIISPDIKQVLLVSNKGLLCIALAAMGLETNLQLIRQLGVKPLYLAGISWAFLAGLSLSLIVLLGA